MADKKSIKTEYQKRKERKEAKNKAEAKERTMSDFEALSQRHSEAMDTHKRIAEYAYGKRPETLSMPDELSGTPLGGQFTTPRSLPTGDDEPIPSLATMLRYKNEGVETNDPKAMIRRSYNAPPPVPSSSGEFMGHARTDRKTPATDESIAQIVSNRARTLAVDPDFKEFANKNQLTAESSATDVVGAMVSERKSRFSEGNSVDWYEGPKTGITETGYPQYAEGSSPALVKRYAAGAGVDPSDLRRATAMVSPKAKWEEKGEYPNVEAAMMGMHAAQNTSMDEYTAGRRVARTVGGGPLPENIRKAYRQAKGLLSPAFEVIRPSKSTTIATAKQSNFDKALSSPYNEEGVYSPLIAYEKSQAYTSDTHDIGVAGIKTGKIGKRNPAESWLTNTGGQDLSIASAQIASADLFNEHYNKIKNTHGHETAEKWAEENAKHYSPANFQATLWEGEREK